MNAFVIDVNVPIVTNGRSPQADKQCFKACVNALEAVQKSGKVLLDDGGLILREYMNKLEIKGQPGLGNAFMKWVWERQGTARCEMVSLTMAGNGDDDFSEFPRDSALKGFDRADRKYVAVALASKASPVVLNAVDRGWWKHKDVLAKCGVTVEFLCPQCMNRGRDKK